LKVTRIWVNSKKEAGTVKNAPSHYQENVYGAK